MKHFPNERILDDILYRYSLEQSNVVPLGGCENQVFQVFHNAKSYILRLTSCAHRAYPMIKAEVHWINYLYDRGVRVCRALLSRNYEAVEMVPFGENYISAVLFEKALGCKPNLGSLEPYLIRLWGEALGKMHALARDYQLGNPAYSRAHWEQDDKFNIECFVPQSQTVVYEKFHSLVARLHLLPIDSSSYGLIHADLNTDNFFVDEHGITIFDFDDCIYSWYLYDIAAIVFTIVDEHQHMKDRNLFVHDFLDAFCDGYCTSNRLDLLRESAWTDLLKLQEFERYITLHRIPELRYTHREEYEQLRYNLENDIPYLDVQFP